MKYPKQKKNAFVWVNKDEYILLIYIFLPDMRQQQTLSGLLYMLNPGNINIWIIKLMVIFGAIDLRGKKI